MSGEKKFFTRMGDGSIVYMTEAEIRADIQAGVEDAASRGKIPPLTQEEMDKIYDIVTAPAASSASIPRMPWSPPAIPAPTS